MAAVPDGASALDGDMGKLSMKSDEKVEVGGTVRKGAADKREYRVIRLQNGLQALLISTANCPVTVVEV
jgi:hypothetical protein